TAPGRRPASTCSCVIFVSRARRSVESPTSSGRGARGSTSARPCPGVRNMRAATASAIFINMPSLQGPRECQGEALLTQHGSTDRDDGITASGLFQARLHKVSGERESRTAVIDIRDIGPGRAEAVGAMADHLHLVVHPLHGAV